MPIKDKQKLITQIVSGVLNESAQESKTFDWLINQHKPEHFKMLYPYIDKIFLFLNGQADSKSIRKLQPDAYFGGKYNFIFEFDEFQHFTTARLNTFQFYPKGIELQYSTDKWQLFCKSYLVKADGYRYSKTTSDFNFAGGRTSQRAYLDCFRDLLPHMHGLNPTLRIAEFEVAEINKDDLHSRQVIKKLLRDKMHLA